MNRVWPKMTVAQQLSLLCWAQYVEELSSEGVTPTAEGFKEWLGQTRDWASLPQFTTQCDTLALAYDVLRHPLTLDGRRGPPQ